MENNTIENILKYGLIVLVAINAALTAIKTVCDSVIEKFNKGQNVNVWVVKILSVVSKVIGLMSANTQKTN